MRFYSVIYQAIDDVEAALKGMLKPEYEEIQLAAPRSARSTARRSSATSRAASCGRRDPAELKARLVRDGSVVADNLSVESLRRFKDDATEVREGLSAVSAWGRSTTSRSTTSSRPSRCGRRSGCERGRARRLGERIHEIVAEALKFKIKDPRVGFVTVTDVRVTADLRDATVFYTVLGDAEEQEATAGRAVLGHRPAALSEVGKGTGVKFTPTLTFVPDAVPENARHIEDLLRETAERDSAIAAAAAGARFAGDADPLPDAGR